MKNDNPSSEEAGYPNREHFATNRMHPREARVKNDNPSSEEAAYPNREHFATNRMHPREARVKHDNSATKRMPYLGNDNPSREEASPNFRRPTFRREDSHLPGCARHENSFQNHNAKARKSFAKPNELPKEQTVKRKLGYILSAMWRYYGIKNLQVAIDHDTSLVSTEVGILHHLFAKMLPQRHRVSANACVADCMCGLGTMSMCAYLHSEGGHVFALDNKASAVALARQNLQALTRLKGRIFGVGPAEMSGVDQDPAVEFGKDKEAGLEACEEEASLESQPESGKDQEAVVKSEPESGKDQEAAVQSQPESGKHQEASLESQPESGKDQEAVVKSEPESGKDQEAALESQPESGKDQEAAVQSEPESSDDANRTLESQPESGDDEAMAQELALHPGTQTSFSVLEAPHNEFLATEDSKRVELLLFSAAWEAEHERSPELLLSQMRGLTMQGSHPKLQTIVMKIAPNYTIRVEDVAFAKKATQYAVQFYGRHAFDFLILDGPWHESKDTLLMHLAEPVRSATRTTPKWQLVRSVPYTGMVPHGVSMPDAAVPFTDYVSAINYNLQDNRTTISNAISPDLWNGKTPQGMHVHHLDIECLFQARQQAETLFKELVRMEALGLQRGLGITKWPSTHEQGTLHESKTTLARHYNYLYNVVTDVEHFIRSTLARSQQDLERSASLQFVHLERGTGIPLHVPVLRSERDVVFIVSLERVFGLDFAPSLVPGEVGGPGYHLRTTQARGAVVLLQNEARSMWAHGVPYGSPYEQFLLLYTVHEEV